MVGPRSRSLLEDWWLPTLGSLTSALLLAALLPKLGDLERYLGPDGFVFEYAGWLMTKGGVTYVAVWDPKPPVIHELMTILAFLSWGNASLLHHVAVLLTVGVAGFCVLALGGLVYRFTSSNVAAVLAGATFLTLPTVYVLPTQSPRPKFFTLAFGLLAIYAADTDRPATSGALAALSAGTWQLGIVFVVIVLGFQRDKASIVRVLGGTVTVGFLAVLPYVLTGALWPMLRQTVIAPLTITEHRSVTDAVQKGRRFLGPAVPLATAGILSTIAVVLADHRRYWWLGVGGGWFTVQLLYLDFDGPPDLLLWLAFIGLGVGLLAGSSTVGPRTRIALASGLGLVVLVALVSSNPWIGDGLATNPIDVPPVEEIARIDQSLLWEGEFPPSCHVRESGLEVRWRELVENTC